MHSLSPYDPKAKWFHENTLTIDGDKAVLQKNPRWRKNGKTWKSASDGGFYTYRGTIKQIDASHWTLTLSLTDSDYAAVEVDKNHKPIEQKPVDFPVTRMKDGALLIDHLTYRISKVDPDK